MIHVDPASPSFTKLPRQQQAGILRYQFNWTTRSLADEFGVSETTIRVWTTPGQKDRERERAKAYRNTEKGRQVRRDMVRRYRAKKKVKAEIIFVDPKHPAFASLPREYQARIYLAMGLGRPEIARKMKAHPNSVRYWVDLEFRERKKAECLKRHHERAAIRRQGAEA